MIESPPADIVAQMAVDRALFEEFVRDSNAGSPPILRLYRVDPPGISVGRASRNDDLVVRPTGGGLVRHGGDFIYSVIARKDTFPTFGLVRTSYLSFHEVVQEAFQALGIETKLFRCDEAKAQQKKRGGECFKEPIATDVLLGNHKVAGGAQWRSRGSFLHQGSVQLLPEITFEKFKKVFIDAFQERFGIVWDKMIFVL